MIVNGRSVLITGASTGIGRSCALWLAQRGWTVYAGVRKAADGDALRAAHEAIVPVTIDVTDDASIARAVETIGAQNNGRLFGLVNNAGIAVAGPLEVVGAAGMRRQLDVNVVGVVAVTTAFLPLLRAARGRIINMSSISGRSSFPFLGPYAASKHALEALSDSWRVELRNAHIEVVLIEPGQIKTPIWEKARGETPGVPATPEMIQRYRAPMEQMAAIAARGETQGQSPEIVARAVETALTVPKPRDRYLIGVDAFVQLAIRALPARVRDSLYARLLKI